MQQHTVIALMHDRPGVLNRAVSLFRRRAFNIDSLSVATTEQPGLSRMTLVVRRDDVTQVIRQLERLVDIVSVRDVTFEKTVSHELCLVRLGAPGHRLGDLLRIARECDARVVETAQRTMILAVMGDTQAVSSCLERLRPFGILELTRSGRVAMTVTASAGNADSGTTTPASRVSITPAPYAWQADGAVDGDAA